MKTRTMGLRASLVTVAAALPVAMLISVPTAHAAPGQQWCTTTAQGGKDPDTAAVRAAVESAVASAEAAGITLGVAISGAGNTKPVISSGAADTDMYSASTVKVAVATTVYDKGIEGDKQVDISEDQVVGGTGSLLAGSYPVSELMTKMITISDNTATNALIREVGGFDPVNEVIQKAGITSKSDYHLGNFMMADAAERDSHITANGAATYLTKLCQAANKPGGFVSPETAAGVLALMGGQTVKTKLGAGFETIADKTGEGDTVSHDIGIVGSGSRWYVIAATATFSGDIGAANAQIASLSNELAPLLT